MDKYKDSSIDLEYLAIWAAEVIKEVAVKKDLVRRSFKGLDPDLLSYVGLGTNTFNRLQEDMSPITNMGPGIKRLAIQDPEERPKRQLAIEEVQEKSPEKEVCQERSHEIEEHLINLSLETHKEGQLSWKKEARRSQRVRARQTEVGESSSHDPNHRRHLDFQ